MSHLYTFLITSSSLPGCSLTREDSTGKLFLLEMCSTLHACMYLSRFRYLYLLFLALALGVVVHWCIPVFFKRAIMGGKQESGIGENKWRVRVGMQQGSTDTNY